MQCVLSTNLPREFSQNIAEKKPQNQASILKARKGFGAKTVPAKCFEETVNRIANVLIDILPAMEIQFWPGAVWS